MASVSPPHSYSGVAQLAEKTPVSVAIKEVACKPLKIYSLPGKSL
jgi:hypothetical protein